MVLKECEHVVPAREGDVRHEVSVCADATMSNNIVAGG